MAKIKASSHEKNFDESEHNAQGRDMANCPVTTAINVIGGKWKVIILYQLRGQTLRFGELKRVIPKITQKMLTQQLRELEKDKLVKRVVYAEVPPKVEYTSTELAEKLNPALDLLCAWGSEYEKAHQSE
ncbi:winged helix-turn-helix transcriptional regulator [Aliikangiella coralliicola]|uniref:Helix-turn-helix transcriptional regulator n=1 Tax=Aliikangiella coralliicola TaxID=2592383 RepID=A0A545UA60_9GAMM|nr:helix-turn-helix domain-containing protein [Aliikangiella coralliicola]TQV86356.1 helix-turn-helix transcriptional regulator [Aliikangiella coralliicola]